MRFRVFSRLRCEETRAIFTRDDFIRYLRHILAGDRGLKHQSLSILQSVLLLI